MKNVSAYLFTVVCMCFVGCSCRPLQKTSVEMYRGVTFNTEYLQEKAEHNSVANPKFWYVGSDDQYHYFGGRRYAIIYLPFTNKIVFFSVLKSEMTIDPERALRERLWSGTALDDPDRIFWSVPTSVRLSSDIFPGPMVVATLTP